MYPRYKLLSLGIYIHALFLHHQSTVHVFFVAPQAGGDVLVFGLPHLSGVSRLGGGLAVFPLPINV